MSPMKNPELDNTMKTRACGMCHIQLSPGEAHLSSQHCIRELVKRLQFLGGVCDKLNIEVDFERTAIQATHRLAWILLQTLSDGRLILGKEKFENVAAGAGVTMSETDNGDYEIVGVVTASGVEVAKS